MTGDEMEERGLFLKVHEGTIPDHVENTRELAPGVAIDVDAAENIVGVTITEPAWGRIKWMISRPRHNERRMMLEAVLAAIAGGYAFRGITDPRELARRTLDRDWPGTT